MVVAVSCCGDAFFRKEKGNWSGWKTYNVFSEDMTIQEALFKSWHVNKWFPCREQNKDNPEQVDFRHAVVYKHPAS